MLPFILMRVSTWNKAKADLARLYEENQRIEKRLDVAMSEIRRLKSENAALLRRRE
jgi:hypothetical protein